MIHPIIRRREWRNVFLFALAVMLLTALPYLIGAAAQRADRHFGWFTFGYIDGNSYLAKMRQGAVDGWLFHNVYTPEPHDGAVLFTPYLAAGKLAALLAPPSSPAFVDAMLLVFHASRVVFGILLILIVYRFIAMFLVKRSLRWLALVLITLCGGFGWLLVVLGQKDWLGSLPIDILLPEGYTVYMLYGLPHLSLARAAMLGGLLLTFQAVALPSPRQWIPVILAAGVCWLVMGLCVPFYIAVLFAILGAWGLAALIRFRRFPVGLFVRGIVGALIPLPYLLYNLYVFATNPVLATWGAQNVLPTPNPLHFIPGYGLLALLALPAFRWAWQRSQHQIAYLLLPAWSIAAPLMAYLPIAVQRRLLEGFFVPMCILAVMGLRLWWMWMQSRFRWYPRRARMIWREAVISLLLVLLPSSLMILLSGVSSLSQADVTSRLFHTDAEIAALDWLNTNAVHDAIVLSSFETGNYVPARASLRTFMGHSPETLRLDEKHQLADQYFSGKMTSDEQTNFLRQYNIRYVIYDPGVEVLSTFGLTRIYGDRDYLIYQVNER